MRVTRTTPAFPRHDRYNEARWDRGLRLVVGGSVFWLGSGPMDGTRLGLSLATIAALVFVTGLVGWCPLYRLFDLSTVWRARDPRGAAGVAGRR